MPVKSAGPRHLLTYKTICSGTRDTVVAEEGEVAPVAAQRRLEERRDVDLRDPPLVGGRHQHGEVQAASAAVRACGLEPEPRIINGGLDANWLTARGLPTVTLGCGQAGIHTVNETLDVDEYLQACRIGLLLATGAETAA